MPRSLRGELLGWLLIPLAGVVAFNVWTTNQSAFETANLITDRTLLASARVIAEQVKETDGSIEALIPPSALEMFASPDRDRVIYRIIAPSGELIAGFPDVAIPSQPPSDLQPVFFDARFRVEDIRAVAVAQPVVSRTASGNALVVVGTTLRGRDRLVAELWRKSLQDQILLVGVAALLALFGLQRGLEPLLRLRNELAERDPSSLRPLASEDVQVELKPLVDALNHAFERVQNYVALQRRFIANASHQLRTPLAVLKTQSTVGMRELSPAIKDDALVAIDKGLDALTRLVNQLLTLARAEPGASALRREPVDFVSITRMALEGLAPMAFDRAIDLTFEAETDDMYIRGHAILLRELVANLVENALRYTPKDGEVSVKLRHQGNDIELVVEDAGPGIPEHEREKAFERFYRIPSAEENGTGLGLAIVKEIAKAHEGDVILSSRTPPPGLRAQVRLPAEQIGNFAA